MKNRLGCLSWSGIIIAGLVLAGVCGFVGVGGGAIFSPGPLNAQAGEQKLGDVRTHADLSRRCEACHAPFWGREIMSDRCLGCHTEIEAELKDLSSLHGTLMTGAFTPCQQCHTEHQGVSAELTVIDRASFPHQATGYALRAHRRLANGDPFTCASCHPQSLTHFELLTCEHCHYEIDAAFTQAHINTFGPACLACHDGLDSYGTAFDHSTTSFPLAGKHASTACAGCHQGQNDLINLQATSQECYACHKEVDAHNGQFGQNCAACHTVNSWTPAAFNGPHSFPMDHGADRASPCQTCHVDNLQTYTCYACHEHTPIEIEEKHLEEGIRDFQDCTRCHPTGREEDREEDEHSREDENDDD